MQPLRHIRIEDRRIVDENVRFYAYTVYRDPVNTHIPDGADKITYRNAARSINSYQRGEETVHVYLRSQSTYAEKFIAPAGFNNWSKQGLALKTGTDFDYLLRVTNETGSVHTGLTVYDTLPGIGDRDIFGGAARNSEFPVILRQAITPPEGYRVYYTTSPDVFGGSMHEMLDADIWSDSVSDYASVTAFKLVANAGTVLDKDSLFRVRIPVRVPETLGKDSLTLLHENQTSSLEALNAFGFRTTEAPREKESNTVWARIPFASLSVRKVDEATGSALAGAEFQLRDQAGNLIAAAVSDEQGLLRFRDLTEGTYTLTETKVPAGYMDKNLSLTVTITQNSVTMDYSFAFSSGFTGAGTGADPLRVPNSTTYVLPETGGSETAGVYALGVSLLLLAAFLPVLGRRKN